MKEYHIDGMKFDTAHDISCYIANISSNELNENNIDENDFIKEITKEIQSLKIGDVLEYYGTEVWIEDLVPDDYTLELYDVNGNWIEQIMVSTEYQDILDYEKENPIDEDKYYYSEWFIQYDNETGEEMCSGPMV